MSAQLYFDAAAIRDEHDHGDAALPPEVTELLAHLTDAGREAFLSDLGSAVEKAKLSGNVDRIRQVLEAWYRTLAVVAHGDSLDEINEALASTEEPQDLEGLLSP